MNKLIGVVGGVGLLLAALAAGTRAQEAGDRSVEGRLLQILKDRGIISEGEFTELKKLEEELRSENDLEGKLNGRIDELVARMADEGPKTGYKIGKGFNWTTPDEKFSLTIGGRMQVRFTDTEYTKDVSGSKHDENEPQFDVPRMRIWLQGYAFEPYWKYEVQFDLAGDTARGPVSVSGGGATSTGTYTSQNRLSELKDAFIDFVKWDPFNIKAGQFKVPYSRQQLTSASRQQFVDRAITDRAFAVGRDHGVMAYGKLGGEKNDVFEYYFGLFDGEGENFLNNDDGLMYAGRVAVNPLGGIPYSESDLSGSEQFKLAVGANAWYHDNNNHSQTTNESDVGSLGGDLTMTWIGFFFTGEVHYREDQQAGPDLEALGWTAQIGYFIVPHELEIALRAANVDWDHSTANTAQREYLIELGYFFSEHNMKVQTDFGRVELRQSDPTKNDDEWRWRLQLQITF